MELSCLSSGLAGSCLSYTLKVVSSTLLGLFNKCLGTPDAKWGICPGTYAWSCSAETAVLITSADILGVSPWQMSLL